LRATRALSNLAISETSPDAAAWTAIHTGFLNSIKLADAGEYELVIGDTDRREQEAELFRTPTATFPMASCILAGPILAGATYLGTPKYAWGGVYDRGPVRFRVIANPSGLVNNNRVTLQLVSGPLRPRYAGAYTKFLEDERNTINRLAEPFWEPDPDARFATDGSQQSQPWGWFPNLTARLTNVATAAVIDRTPIAVEAKKASTVVGYSGPPDYPWGKEKWLVNGYDQRFIVYWPEFVSIPAVGTLFDVSVFANVVSKNGPLHLRGHPVDLLADAATQEGIAIDATSRAATKTALGDLMLELQIEGVVAFKEFASALKGAFGFATRYLPSGAMEFFPVRVATPAVVATITASLIWTEGEDGPDPVIFSVAEEDVINGVD
jgi:hypothetical protein